MSDTTYGTFDSTFVTPLVPPSCDACLSKAPALLTILGLKNAFTILQNLTTIAYMNPLVINVQHLSANAPGVVDYVAVAAQFNVPLHPLYATSQFSAGQWAVTDQLTPDYQLTYHTAQRNTITGIETLTDAGSGTTIHGKWDILPTAKHPGQLTLTEKSTTRALESTLAYIESTTDESHNALHDNFKALWEQMMCQVPGVHH